MSFEDYDEFLGNSNDEEYLICLEESASEEEIIDILFESGVIQKKQTKYSGTMEKLVFMYGISSEVYSSEEIKFIESQKEMYLFHEYYKSLNNDSMLCQVIAANLDTSGYSALKACIAVEKIINKAFDGFNIYFFITNEGVFFGCRRFDDRNRNDCTLSVPIINLTQLTDISESLSFCASMDKFIDFYQYIIHVLTEGTINQTDYEKQILKKRGIQYSYLDKLDQISRDIGVDLSGAKKHYRDFFYDESNITFAQLLQETEDDLSFIKSQRVNTSEILFDAEETFQKALQNESNLEINNVIDINTDYTIDREKEELLDDPEALIKFLKSRL